MKSVSGKVVFVVGASGATGRRLVLHLLKSGITVKAVVRSPERLPESIRKHKNLVVVQGNVLDFSMEELAALVKDCAAAASCLGHNMSFKGMYGHPRKLVRDSVRKICEAIKANNPEKPVKFVLMNTAGVRNRHLKEPLSFGQRSVVGLLRVLLPPHVDNEKAADYLRTRIGRMDPSVQWAVVRPDSLMDEEEVSEYEIHPSPTRSALFNPGKTSRINVGHFMARLINDEDLWRQWKSQMPVIYNIGK